MQHGAREYHKEVKELLAGRSEMNNRFSFLSSDLTGAERQADCDLALMFASRCGHYSSMPRFKRPNYDEGEVYPCVGDEFRNQFGEPERMMRCMVRYMLAHDSDNFTRATAYQQDMMQVPDDVLRRFIYLATPLLPDDYPNANNRGMNTRFAKHWIRVRDAAAA